MRFDGTHTQYDVRVAQKYAAFFWVPVQQSHRYIEDVLPINDEAKVAQLHACAEEFDDSICNTFKTTACLKNRCVQASDLYWSHYVLDAVSEKYEETMNVSAYQRNRFEKFPARPRPCRKLRRWLSTSLYST